MTREEKRGKTRVNPFLLFVFLDRGRSGGKERKKGKKKKGRREGACNSSFCLTHFVEAPGWGRKEREGKGKEERGGDGYAFPIELLIFLNSGGFTGRGGEKEKDEEFPLLLPQRFGRVAREREKKKG